MGASGGAYLKELREDRRLSLEQVVQILLRQFRIHISRSGLSRYEKGTRTHPDALVLWGLSRVYDASLEDILLNALGRRDLPRHTGSADSADALSPSPRDAELAASLEVAAHAITDAIAALRGGAATSRHRTSARARLHHQAG